MIVEDYAFLRPRRTVRSVPTSLPKYRIVPANRLYQPLTFVLWTAPYARRRSPRHGVSDGDQRLFY